jgi:hypothetical protein
MKASHIKQFFPFIKDICASALDNKKKAPYIRKESIYQ